MPKGRHYKIQFVEAIDAHDRAIKIGGGGREGIMSLDLIESAIGRPYTGYYRSIYKKAAALTESICRNHGFIDGNKRTALYLVELLVEQSGYKLRTIPDDDLVDFYVAVANGVLCFEEVENWYIKNIKPVA